MIGAGPISDVDRYNPFVVTRGDLLHQFIVAEPDNYLALKANVADVAVLDQTPQSGLRDDNGNGVPDIAYITGGGLSDHLILRQNATDPLRIHVTFRDTVFDVVRSEYDVVIGVDTEGTIVIDPSHGDDLIEIAASIAAHLRFGSEIGSDTITLLSTGAGNHSVRSSSMA